MNNFTQRVLFAVPAAALFLWVTWLGGWAFQLMASVIALFIVFEMARLYSETSTTSSGPSASSSLSASVPPVIIIAGISLSIAAAVFLTLPIPEADSYLVGTTILMMALYAFVGQSKMERWVYTVLSGLYAPVAFRLLIRLRSTDVPVEGFYLLLLLFLAVWGNDVFAYLGGKGFGRHKMAPSVSPGKTWEGFATGFFGAAVGFFLIIWIESIFVQVPMEYASISGRKLSSLWPIIILVSLVGPVGDLLESWLKRKKGVKDSSTILPGHGGFFDRFDAMIPSILALWAYLQLIRTLS